MKNSISLWLNQYTQQTKMVWGLLTKYLASFLDEAFILYRYRIAFAMTFAHTRCIQDTGVVLKTGKHINKKN